MAVTWTQRPVDAPDGDLLSGDEVARCFGVSRDTLDRWISEGEFPAGLLVGKKALVWDWQSVAFYRLKLALSPRLVAEKSTAHGGK
jgi:excisionase family DNA binding protein